MENLEKLKIKVGISGTYWGDKTPEYRVSIDGNPYVTGYLSVPSGEEQTIEFDTELGDGEHSLEISFLNKDSSTDVVKDESNNVIKDILLNVENIEIDDIDIGHLKYSKSYYALDKKQLYKGEIVTQIDNCVNLGFNGTYVMKFNSPFYLWLLENM